MSALSDLFEGRFSNLGTDITHAPSSFVRDIGSPSEFVPLAAGAALLTGGLLAPELLGAGAAGADVAAGAADVGAAADAGLTAADIAGGATAADLAAGGATAADIAAGAGTATDVAALAGGDALATLPADALALAPDVAPSAFASGFDLSGGTGLATAASDAGTISPDIGGYAGTSGADVGGYADTTATAADTSSGGGLTQTLKDTLTSPWTKLALAATPLALTLARGEPSLPSQVNPAVTNATALAQQGANLNPAQTASLQQMRQDAINAARQAMFNQGVTTPEADSRWPQYVAQVDSQVTAAAQTMIQQNIANSLAGDQQLINIAQLQMSADQQFTNNLVNATKAFGTVAGLGSGTTINIGSSSAAKTS